MEDLTLVELLKTVAPEADKSELPTLIGPILRLLAKEDKAQSEAFLRHQIKPRFNLTEHEINSYRQTINDYRKQLRLADSSTEEKKTSEFSAAFEGLVDLVADDDGNPAFLVKEGDEVVVLRQVERDGKVFLPPPKDQIRWLLPSASDVLTHVTSGAYFLDEELDADLYDDLRKYFEDVSELPENGYYDLLAGWTMHTYLLEAFQYSPMLCMFAVPERGKTRTGKAIIYVAYRGVHVESLREPYILRLADRFNSTFFFDVMDLWQKAEKMNSVDILLQRFERGVDVPRVLNPDAGPHQDIKYFRVFGPTIIGTNESAHKILNTRCLPMNMPESNRVFQNNVTPEGGLYLKARLVAFRARHMDKKLKPVSNPAPGRLGAITAPLLQIIELVRPEMKNQFLELIRKIYDQKLVENSETLEAQVLKAVIDLEATVSHGLLPIKEVTEQLNVNLNKTGGKEFTPKRIGNILGSLGFEKGVLVSGASAIFWDATLIDRLKQRYGLNQHTDVTEHTDVWSGSVEQNREASYE